MEPVPGLEPEVTPESRLRGLGLELPGRPPEPIGNFRNVIRVDKLLYVSGQGPVTADGRIMTGKVGRTVGTEEARDHARLVGLNILAAVRWELGDLSRIKRVVKVFGMVNATEDFADHPVVINGCSDLLCAVLALLIIPRVFPL